MPARQEKSAAHPGPFRPYSATYLILIKNRRVLLLRRANTGWRDGSYSLVAGHIDENETARQAMVREAQEEVGITIKEEDLRFAHLMHRGPGKDGKGRTYYDIYFTTEKWKGEPKNLEPGYCDDLNWADVDRLPKNTVSNVIMALGLVKKGLYYSESEWA
jgi:8-oxo-dGTP pyrophosphatase MutT (NUDIX family)